VKKIAENGGAGNGFARCKIKIHGRETRLGAGNVPQFQFNVEKNEGIRMDGGAQLGRSSADRNQADINRR